MATPNITPIFSRVADIQGGQVLKTAAADFTGNNINNVIVYTADATNGGFIQRIRMKALGTNIATVARIYVLPANTSQFTSLMSTPTTLAGVAGTTGGTLATTSYYGVVQACDLYGNWTATSTESSAVSVTGPTGNIAWTWVGNAQATAYRLFVGGATTVETSVFTTTTNSYSQTIPVLAGNNNIATPLTALTAPALFIGEISLPATTLSTSSATAEIDYPINSALPPGYSILVGLGTTVAAGWAMTSFAGKY